VYASDVLKVLRRRWYLVLTGLVLVAGASIGVFALVPTQYEAKADVLFLLPANSASTPVNPYLNLQQGLSTTASILGGVVTTPETQREVFKSGFTADYAVAQQPGTGVPLLSVSAQSGNADMAVATVSEIVRRINDQLASIQRDAGAPASQFITSRTFSLGNQAEALRGAKIRALAVVVALGMTLTVLVTLLIDRLRRGTGRRAVPAGGGLPAGSVATVSGRRTFRSGAQGSSPDDGVGLTPRD
jgi:hypothetical protein